MLRYRIWKALGLDREPDRIWWVAGPLAVLGLGLGAVRAILEWAMRGDPWFFVIYVALVALGGTAFYRMFKTYRRFS